MSKPRVLVLGGAGFIGRNLVQYLVQNDLTSKIRVADKALPALVSLSAEQKAIFDKIEFKQVNLSRATTIAKVFESDEKFDYVFNLAGETKYGQEDTVYRENIINVSVTCATEAAKHGVKRFIEVSTAQVYESGSKPRKENAKIKPWTGIAKAKLEAENQLLKMDNLNVVIVRPATVYGPGDLTGVMPRLVIAAVYKSLQEKMEFLWDKDLRINTVHVRDVVAALWFLTTHGENKQIFNLADQSDTTQGSINNFIEAIFGIKTGFMGNVKSKLATSVAMKTVADTANDKHLKPWSDLCKQAKISTTQLTPYLDEELLYDNDLSVDGTFITTLGFKYEHPQMQENLLREAINYYLEQDSFPRGIL
jgi:nucleoside-diphosphate-sugar epimerase